MPQNSHLHLKSVANQRYKNRDDDEEKVDDMDDDLPVVETSVN